MKIVNLKIEIKGQQIELTLQEARELWCDLNGLFGNSPLVNLEHFKAHLKEPSPGSFQPLTIPSIPISDYTPRARNVLP